MNRASHRLPPWRWIVGLMLLFGAWEAASQEMDTVITTQEGNQLRIFQDTAYTIDRFMEDDAMFVMTPKEGAALAHATITRASETIHFYAKKITYYPKRDDFLLEEEARIEGENNQVTAPQSIQFEAAKNQMVVEGTEQTPAMFTYNFGDGRRMKSYARRFDFYFVMVEGARKLNKIESKP